MGVNPKIGGKPPKWMIYNGKPYFFNGWFGGPTPIFGNTHIHQNRHQLWNSSCSMFSGVFFATWINQKKLLNLMTNDFHQIYLSIIKGRCSSSMSVLSLVHPNINCGTNHLPSVTPDCILHLAFRQCPEGGKIWLVKFNSHWHSTYTHTIHGTGIFTYMNGWFLLVNVGKYTSPMDPLGYENYWVCAIPALGSLAIIKLSGQNCWGRSVLGRQKVPRKVPLVVQLQPLIHPWQMKVDLNKTSETIFALCKFPGQTWYQIVKGPCSVSNRNTAIWRDTVIHSRTLAFLYSFQ